MYSLHVYFYIFYIFTCINFSGDCATSADATGTEKNASVYFGGSVSDAARRGRVNGAEEQKIDCSLRVASSCVASSSFDGRCHRALRP